MENLFNTVLRMSLTGSYVILMILLIRVFLKIAPKWISYALWLVAGFRLAFPFTIKTAISLFPKRTVNSGLVVDEVIGLMFGEKIISRGNYEPVSSFIAEKTAGTRWSDFVFRKETLMYIWFFGAAILMLYYVYSAWRIKRMLKSARQIEEYVFEADNITTPFVFGLTNPRIYLPKDLPERDQEHILLHEKIHVRRKDSLVKAISYFLLCIHWFNPLVWIAFHAMSSDMELSCDEKVLLEKGIHIKKNYAGSLLALASPTVSYSGSQLAFGHVSVKARIKNALNYRKPKFFISFIAIVTATVLGLGLSTTPIEGSVFKDVEASVQALEVNRTGSGYEIAYDEDKLHAYGRNYEGISNTLSYNILPKENIFDFELRRHTEILTAEIVFPSADKDALYFVVDLLEKKVLSKTIYDTEFQLSGITDEELIDMALSMKRLSIGVPKWKD